MPKELHEITKFTTGTITVPDEKDIPEDAASYSLNIDSVTEGGKLKGVPGDLYLKNDGTFGSSSTAETVDAQVMSMINRDGYHDLVYFEDDTGKIWNITDIYNTASRTDTTIAAVASDPATITDSDSEFITSGFRAGQLIHVTGFTGDADNNTTYKLKSVAAGTLTLTNSLGNGAGSADAADGETVTIKTYKKTDMGSARSANGWRTGVAGENGTKNLGESGEVAMQVHNKEVHVGMGQTSSDTPKWVGYVANKQFGTKTEAMQMEDAELKALGSFPVIYNAVTVDDVVYGIQYGGSRIYKFSATAFDSASYTEFTSTQGISLVAGGSDIWVYDDNAGFGTLFKIDVSEWGTENEISQENNPTGWGGAGTDLDTGFEISDIHHDSVGDVIWFAAYKSGNIGRLSHFLYNTASEPSSSGAITITHRSPTLDGDAAADEGEWTDNSTVINLYKQCLVQTAQGVGLMCFLPADKNLWVAKDPDSYATYEDGLVMFNVEKTYSNDTVLTIDSSDLSGTDDCQIHEVKNSGSATDYGGSSYWGGFWGDNERIIISRKNDTDDSELFAFDDIVHAAVSSGAQSTPTARGDSDTDLGAAIDANGMAFAVPADRDDVYTFEQYGGGGYITLSYNDSAFSSLNYRERSNLRVEFTDSGTGVFRSDDTYFWKFSLMYDGYQESPLSASFTYTPGDDTSNIELDISLFNTSGLSKRVSHLVAYRAEDSNTPGSASPTTFYRFLKKMPLDPSFTIAENVWAGNVDARRKIFVDQLNNQGASYEARTLMPETLESSMVHYSLSTQINSMHIVGKCYKADIPDAKNYLFKSKVNNFDQFDWTTDFLRLPTVPTALASFNGRIYAFDKNNTYRINPNGFYIEDTFEGVGCSGAFAVAVTEYGMCYCDKNNIYLHDGKSPKPIATPILTGNPYYESSDYNKTWHNAIEPDYGHRVMFDSKRKSFMIFFRGLEASGSYTGTGDHATQLTDSAAAFTDEAATRSDSLIGARVHNTTDGSQGVVASVQSSTQLTLDDLLGGSNNFWDDSANDEYVITKSYAWSYNIPHNRWDLIHFQSGVQPNLTLNGKNGELFVVGGNYVLYKFLGSTSSTLDPWEWRSKYMTMGEDTVKKMLYDVKVVGDSTAPTTTYGVDGDTTPTTALVSSKVTTANKKSKSLQIKLIQVAGATHKVDSVGVLYRRLPKTSGNI